MPIFHHSGDLGDVIYSLPTVRALGGGLMQLGTKPCVSTRMAMSVQRFQALKPLLEAQKYVTGVVYGTKTVNVDLDSFRNYHEWADHGMNIAVAHLTANDLPAFHADTKWLTVPKVRKIASTVICRTPRWHNFRFNWDDVINRYPDCVFVGLADDFNAFGHPHVPHVLTDDLLEAAKIIAGADLFIGNQSPMYAIAEGLKMNTVLEISPEMPNCVFQRANAQFNL